MRPAPGRWMVATAVLLAALAGAGPAAAAEARHALVIGNGAYADAPLANPVHDARGMAQALQASGFQVVAFEDVDLVTMARALRDFGDRIAKGGVGLFYFAGHGIQVKGHNYLVPARASIEREDEVAYQALDVNAVLEKMDSARNRSNFVILDACRNNPFAKTFQLSTQGLAPMDAPPGTLIAFATAPGSVAADGAGKNGLYTGELLKQMTVPGLKVEDVFKRTRTAVRAATGGAQVPWENTSLEQDFYFKAPAAAKPGGPARSPIEVAFANPSPAAPRRAAPPTLAVGDRWTYRWLDTAKNEVRTWRFEIGALEGPQVLGVSGDRFDTEWAVLYSVNEKYTFEPRAPRFVWPMTPGAEKKVQYKILGRKEYPDWTITATVRVLGLERVTVPAGTFDAFKIELSGRYRQKTPDGRSGSGSFRNVYWYAPEVKREVVREHESSKWDGTIDFRRRFVLVDYSLR